MRRVDFDELTIRKQHRHAKNDQFITDIIAYDTETIDGRAVLICDNKGFFYFPENFEDCIKMLTRNQYQESTGFFYNLNYDVEAILKFLDQDLIKELAQTGEIKNLELSDGFFVTLQLIDKKMFKIVRDKRAYVFYDIANFLPGGLDKNAEKYLGKKKLKIPINFEKDSNEVIEKFIRSKQGIEYCCEDAKITGELAEMFTDSLVKFKMYTKNFCSPASIATHYFQTKVNIPTLNDLVKGKKAKVKIAYEAYKGGFIQTFKRGYFDNIYLYDINSAYPYALSKLPDLKKGRLILKMGSIPNDAYLGWMRVRIKTTDKAPYTPCYFSPVPVYIKKMNKNFYLAGDIKATITMHEYDALKNDFDIEVLNGCYWIPEEIDLLYHDVINEIYELRKKTKDKNLNVVLKTILNGYYGKLIQKIPKQNDQGVYDEFQTGNLFNPFHASYITAMTRIMIYNQIKTYGAQHLVAVMTDALAFEKKLKIKTSKDLGGWSLDFNGGEGVFIGSGLYTLKKGDDVKTATRGFKMTKKVNFLSLLAKNRRRRIDPTIIKMPQKIRLTYREALRVKKFFGWNIINKDVKKININCDNKRIWERDFKNCDDVLTNVIDSAPIFVNM